MIPFLLEGYNPAELILLAGCEEPQKYYSILNRYLYQALENPNFDSNSKIKIGSKIIFTIAPTTSIIMEYFGEPSARIILDKAE